MTTSSAPTRDEKAARFLARHVPGDPLVMPNPWDIGSARLLAACGFAALATTSSGMAGSMGRLDGRVARDEAFAHAEQIAGAVDVPVSADFERGFAREPEAVAETVRQAIGLGLAGCSIEDFSGPDDEGIYATDLAVERVAAAASAAHADGPFVLTARAEGLLHDPDSLPDVIDRLQRYRDAGADAVFAPGLVRAADIGAVTAAVDAPVNVLALPGVPSVSELADLGVARVSVGGAFSLVAMGAMLEAADELRASGTYGYYERALAARDRVRAAFG
jgi:2-methylisocitrate lyase-like PEP mutase family enzyme